MRSVLVCVRTAGAAQRITAYAARLGVARALRTALSGDEALARLSEQPADVVVVDITIARPDPVQFTRKLLSRSPQATLLLVGAEDPRVAAAAVAAGARGVIRTGEPGDDLVTALTRGILMVCPNGARTEALQRHVSGNHRVVLTERELQVLRGMSEGWSNAEIGRQLYVSEDTVKTHARRLFRKLGARDRAHAVAAAFRAGLVS
ncbi:MAG: response regulator transcription factor [Micromonosporaceae bacterium]